MRERLCLLCVCADRLMLGCLWQRRYRAMEAAANKLQKEAKGYLDSLRGIYTCLSITKKRAVADQKKNK